MWCYNSIICHVMQIATPTSESCDKIGAMARLFLSYFYYLDQSIESRNESKIETAACVISVLTIDKDIRNKGMQRNYWEGGWLGEGFFQMYQTFNSEGNTSNWSLR